MNFVRVMPKKYRELVVAEATLKAIKETASEDTIAEVKVIEEFTIREIEFAGGKNA